MEHHPASPKSTLIKPGAGGRLKYRERKLRAMVVLRVSGPGVKAGLSEGPGSRARIYGSGGGCRARGKQKVRLTSGGIPTGVDLLET